MNHKIRNTDNCWNPIKPLQGLGKGGFPYHYEDKDWDLFHCKEVATAPEWDGHTDKDVERVLSLSDDESDWAAREVALASQKERESAEDKDDWDYGVAC